MSHFHCWGSIEQLRNDFTQPHVVEYRKILHCHINTQLGVASLSIDMSSGVFFYTQLLEVE